MYKTTSIVLKHSETKLIDYCEKNAKLAKLFKNAVTYRCRQLFFAYKKNYKELSEQEQEVIDEFGKIGVTFPLNNKYQYLPGKFTFDKMFRATKNPDYFNDLPSHSTQQIIGEVLESFKSYDKAMISYNKDRSKFTGKPKLPKYVKNDEVSFTISNQHAVIKKNNFLKLPKTKKTVNLGCLKVGKLKEVQIKPHYDTYKICIVEEIEDMAPRSLDNERIIGIDLGINNFASVSNNCGLTPFVINGNGLKAYNQWYNKTLASHQSNLPAGQHTSKKIQQLSKKRSYRMDDFYNKCASYLVKYCIDNSIGTIVIGENKQWKQEINIGKTNNQKFCFIAHGQFKAKLEMMATQVGISVVMTEESYTSKASFLDNDDIPSYDKNNKTTYTFSGTRVHRGLYKSKNGIVMNADINGASNIIRKAIPNAFDKAKDFSHLYTTTIKLNLK